MILIIAGSGSYRILITDGSGSSKTNVLLNLIKHQRPDIDKTYLYVKDPCKSKYQLLINKRGKLGIKHEKNPKVSIDYSQKINDVHENSEDYNQTNKRKVLIVFDNMIKGIETNKIIKLIKPMVAELFSGGRKFKILVVFI